MSLKRGINSLPYIVAVDFDGCLVESNFPDIIAERKSMFEYVKTRKKQFPLIKWVLWTCRHGEFLEEAVKYCKNRGLVFDAVNENIPEVQKVFGTDTRKVYADEYYDDKVPSDNWGRCHE